MRAHLVWWGALISGLVAQTSLFPLIFADAWRPEMTRALVLWVALTGMPRGGAMLALASGFALDLVSGGPLGFCATVRVLLYGLARPFRGVFFDDQPLLLLPFALSAAWFEAALVGVLSWIAFRSPLSLATLASVGLRQSLIDMLWVPLVFVLLELASGRRTPREVAA